MEGMLPTAKLENEQLIRSSFPPQKEILVSKLNRKSLQLINIDWQSVLPGGILSGVLCLSKKGEGVFPNLTWFALVGRLGRDQWSIIL